MEKIIEIKVIIDKISEAEKLKWLEDFLKDNKIRYEIVPD